MKIIFYKFINKIFDKFIKATYRIRKLFFRKNYLDLGSQEASPHFMTLDLSPRADITLDITQPIKENLYNKFDFIWSERLLEHLDSKKMDIVIENIYNMLKNKAFCRLSLPVCYYHPEGRQMMRLGNEEQSASIGHITWFTHEGFGKVSDELFGVDYPPKNKIITWESVLDNKRLKFKPVMYYDESKKLIINDNIYNFKK